MYKGLILGLLSTLICAKVHAASFGTYRIYLDPQTSQDKFVVKNRSVFPEQCDISFTYIQYEANGELVKLTAIEQAQRSEYVLSRLRFSPRQFTIEPKSFQHVTFKLRRQINDEPAEYRTYVNFACTEIKERQVQEGINLTPAMVMAVPLVLRTAPASKMSVNLSFVNVKQQGQSVSFRLEHTGNQSFFGDIDVMAEDGQKLLTLQRNFVMYPEMIYKDLRFSLGEHSAKKVKLVFQDKSQGGDSNVFELSLQGAK
jgi:hypothetical protein